MVIIYIVDTNIGAYYRDGKEVEGKVAFELSDFRWHLHH